MYIFLEILAENMEEWKKVYLGNGTAKDARDFTLATHNVTLQALAIVAGNFIGSNQGKDIMRESWVSYLQPLSNIDFSKTNEEIATIVIRDAKVVKNKETVTQLALYIQNKLEITPNPT